MAGQPAGFDVVVTIPTESPSAQSPALLIQKGDTITLKAYLHFKGKPFEKAAIDTYLTTKNPQGDPEALVNYHLQDLEIGTVVPTIQGGTITALNPTQVADAVAIGDLPLGSIISNPGNEGWWLSADTASITTGDSTSGATLKIPLNFLSGTWRVLTHVHATDPAKQFAAFDDNLIIEVTY